MLSVRAPAATLSCLHCGHQVEREGPIERGERLRCPRCQGNLVLEEVRLPRASWMRTSADVEAAESKDDIEALERAAT